MSTLFDKLKAFVIDNEGMKTSVYFDTVGVATIAGGIALITKNNAGQFVVHTDNFKALGDALGTNTQVYNDLYKGASKNPRLIRFGA